MHKIGLDLLLNCLFNLVSVSNNDQTGQKGNFQLFLDLIRTIFTYSEDRSLLAYAILSDIVQRAQDGRLAGYLAAKDINQGVGLALLYGGMCQYLNRSHVKLLLALLDSDVIYQTSNRGFRSFLLTSLEAHGDQSIVNELNHTSTKFRLIDYQPQENGKHPPEYFRSKDKHELEQCIQACSART